MSKNTPPDPVLSDDKRASNSRYAAARGLRTLLQVSFAEAILDVLESFHLAVLDEAQHTALLLVLTPLLAFVQNFLEARGTLPGMARPEDSGSSG